MIEVIRRYCRFSCLLTLKSLRYIFYPTRIKWLSRRPSKNWKEVRVIVILNHTSLLECVYTGVVPITYLFQIAKRLVLPIASITLDRPLYRFIFKNLAPHLVSLSRKRDETWARFLSKLRGNSILIFLPEGRMKRRDGLDKYGKKMTVRGGIADVLQVVEGKMLFVYSAGLHHVFAPGDWFPRIFRRLHVNMEVVDISSYLRSIEAKGEDLKAAICQDLELRRDLRCPQV